MRYRLGFLVALAVIVLLDLGESEAACRAAGEYRLTGPATVALATLTETASDERGSSGTVVLNLFSKRGCSVCSVGSQTLTGVYHTGLGYDDCVIALRVRDPGAGGKPGRDARVRRRRDPGPELRDPGRQC